MVVHIYFVFLQFFGFFFKKKKKACISVLIEKFTDSVQVYNAL